MSDLQDPDRDTGETITRRPDRPRARTRRRKDRRCTECQGRNHQACTGVGCYGCDPANHRHDRTEPAKWAR